MLTKRFKKIKKIAIAASTLLSLFASNLLSFAKESTINNYTFIPARSYYAKYISENASMDSDIVQYVWLKLFSEESNWGSGQSYYSSPYLTWAHKYYSDYVTNEGKIASSYGTKITYNSQFDSYLYQTITRNDDFIINWINSNPDVFKQYCKTVKSHPGFAKAIIDLTSGSNSNTNFLGDGQYAKNNLFLRGAASTAINRHRGNGSGAKWSVTAANATGYDIDILRVFGNNYRKLNKTQKDWVRTYFSWMIADYISNRSNSLAGESEELLNMIAVSAEAYDSSNPQLFFDYCINNTNANIGEFIANSTESHGLKSTLYTGVDDISSNTDMSVIWDLSDGDCYYTNSSWSGYRAPQGQSADNDYDWLCYKICFDSGAYWVKLKNLVATNPTTRAQMEDWIMRYNTKAASGSNEFANAVARAGQTISEVVSNATWSGCGKTCPENVYGGNGEILYTRDNAFDCGIHQTVQGWNIAKPLGVETISFTIPTHGLNVDSTISYRLYDTTNNRTLSIIGEVPKTRTITVPAKYVWSSTLAIEGITYYRDGNQGHVGKGSCPQTHHGTTTINFTYANVSACVANNHDFTWTYNFYDSDGKMITDDNKTSIPAYCLASGICKNCGHKAEYKDTQLKVNKNGNSTIYTAAFAHSSVPNLGTKSHTVFAPTQSSFATRFTPSVNSGYLSASSELTNFGRTHNITRVYEGDGNAVQLVTTASGTVALKSGAIGAGAKSITVNAVGHDIIYRLMNPITGELKGSRQELIAQSGASECTWNLSGYSDEELEGVYVVVEMYSRDENWAGHALGETVTCSSTVQFNYIEVKY